MVEPVFEKLNFNQRVGELKEQIKVDCKTQISSESVSGVLAVSPWVTADVSEVFGEKVKYGGKVIFYISYLDADGNLRKCECGSEFIGELVGAEEDAKVHLSAEIDKVETDGSGANLAISSFITIKAELSGVSEVSALVGGESLIIKEQEMNLLKGMGARRGVYPIEEEFELNYPVKEVLYHRADAVITAVQCGVGSIIVDGETLLSLVLLQKTDKNDIIRENRIIPFRMEIECEEAMPTMQATARVKEKSFKTDIAVDDDAGKSIVSVDVSLMFEGQAFSSENVILAADAFSTENDVELVKDDCKFYKTCDLRGYSVTVGGRAEISELPVGATVLAVGNEKVSVLSTCCGESGITVTGVLSGTVFLRDADGKVFTRKPEVPFEKVLEGEFNCDTEITVVAKATKANAKIVALTQTDLEADVYFTVYPEERCAQRVVKEIKVLGEKQAPTAAISVYIPTEGEELWSLSKRLNVCPDALIATNKDLNFPLSGKERIVIYRQK